MTYRVLNEPTHQCKLPDADNFAVGTRIRCTGAILRNGYAAVCGKEWLLVNKGIFSKRRQWESIDWAW